MSAVVAGGPRPRQFSRPPSRFDDFFCGFTPLMFDDFSLGFTPLQSDRSYTLVVSSHFSSFDRSNVRGRRSRSSEKRPSRQRHARPPSPEAATILEAIVPSTTRPGVEGPGRSSPVSPPTHPRRIARRVICTHFYASTTSRSRVRDPRIFSLFV